MKIDQAFQLLESDLLKAHQIFIGFSGGVDSHVLLHALAELRKIHPFDLTALHIHHGLQAEADQWVKHCQKICQDLEIPLEIIRVQVNRSKGSSLEEEARIARYQAFHQKLQPGDSLMIAHHADDQAETCFLQFLRGSGLKGLAAMPSKSRFGQGYLLRPFLAVSKQDIIHYAEQHHLNWIEDSSNHDIRFTRNFIRYQIMPLLRDRWPQIAKTLIRVASHCASGDQLLKVLACQDLEKIRGSQPQTLSISKIQMLSLDRKRNVIREWLCQQGFPLPSANKLDHILQNVVESRPDANPCVTYHDLDIRKHQDNLYCFPTVKSMTTPQEFVWDLQHPLTLPGNLGTLTAHTAKGQGIRLPSSQRVTIRFRRGGELCLLHTKQHHKTLKKLFQEWKVPSWERARIPLIYVGDQLAMVLGYATGKNFEVGPEEQGMVIERQT